MARARDLPGVLLSGSIDDHVLIRILTVLSGISDADPGVRTFLHSESDIQLPGLHVSVIAPLRGALYISPITSWFSFSAWSTMIQVVKEYAAQGAMSGQSGQLERRIICVRNVCSLPMHVQHSLRTIIEKTTSTSMFVLTATSLSCIDSAIRSRTLVVPSPSADPPRRAMLLQSLADLADAADADAAAAASEAAAAACAEAADIEHSLAVLERRGAFVGAAGSAIANSLWQRVLGRGSRGAKPRKRKKEPHSSSIL
jgi:hypothetical protein